MRALTPEEYEALRLSDRIEIVGIAAEGVHGVYAEEALAPQAFTVDVTMWLSMSAAVADDELSATIDYVVASHIVREVVETSTVLLVESLAAAVCEALLARPEAIAVRASVHKPRAVRDAHATDVRLTMTRTR
jgi:dihydroneopterin aldolase